METHDTDKESLMPTRNELARWSTHQLDRPRQ